MILICLHSVVVYSDATFSKATGRIRPSCSSNFLC